MSLCVYIDMNQCPCERDGSLQSVSAPNGCYREKPACYYSNCQQTRNRHSKVVEAEISIAESFCSTIDFQVPQEPLYIFSHVMSSNNSDGSILLCNNYLDCTLFDVDKVCITLSLKKLLQCCESFLQLIIPLPANIDNKYKYHQSTRKYHDAFLYCYKCAAQVTMATDSWYFSGIAWCYGDNDFINKSLCV